MSYCSNCGNTVSPGSRFCGLCGQPASQPPQPMATAPSAPPPWAEPPAPAGVTPDLAISALVFGAGALLLVWACWPILKVVPDLARSLFSGNGFAFVFGYLIVIVLCVVLQLAGWLLATSLLLLRRDPAGRWLAALITLLALAFAVIATRPSTNSLGESDPTATKIIWIAVAAIAVATVILFVSPGARRALGPVDGHPEREWIGFVRAGGLIFWLGMALTFPASLGVLRYHALVGGQIIAVVLLTGVSAAALCIGWVQLGRGPLSSGRALFTLGLLLNAVAWVVSTAKDDSSGLQSPGLWINLIGILAFGGALWLPTACREWFAGAALPARG